MTRKVFFCCTFIAYTALSAAAQDFGFGGEDGESGGSGGGGLFNKPAPGLNILLDGYISAAPLIFVQDVYYDLGKHYWSDRQVIDDTTQGDTYHDIKGFKADGMLAARLNFKIASKWADGILNFNIVPTFGNIALKPIDSPSSPVNIDEGYVRAYLGPFTLEGGLRKLTWGRADNMGVLDVTNTYDFTDFTKMDNLLTLKMARPMLHGTLSIGEWTSIEGLFIPWFEPNHYATAGRWTPYKMMGQYMDKIGTQAAAFFKDYTKYNFDPINDLDKVKVFKAYINQMYAQMSGGSAGDMLGDINNVNVLTLKQQYGLRINTTLASADLGFQYFYGMLPNPTVTFDYDFWDRTNIVPQYLDVAGELDIAGSLAASTWGNPVNISYDKYHMAGADYAQVILGFNLRVEFAVTFPFYKNNEFDMDGTNTELHNPFIGWSFGMDRTVAGIMFNLQVVETVRLFNDGAQKKTADIEYGEDVTNTRITFIVSRGFLRDNLNLQANTIWDIEDRDFLIMPSIAYTWGDVVLKLSGGYFGSVDGSGDGQLSQFDKNGFIKIGVTYNF